MFIFLIHLSVASIKIDPVFIPSPSFFKGIILAMKTSDSEISLNFVVLSHEHSCKKDQTKAPSLIYVSYTTTNWFINLQIGLIIFSSPTFSSDIIWAMKKKIIKGA